MWKLLNSFANVSLLLRPLNVGNQGTRLGERQNVLQGSPVWTLFHPTSRTLISTGLYVLCLQASCQQSDCRWLQLALKNLSFWVDICDETTESTASSSAVMLLISGHWDGLRTRVLLPCLPDPPSRLLQPSRHLGNIQRTTRGKYLHVCLQPPAGIHRDPDDPDSAWKEANTESPTQIWFVSLL